jgi:hypothetical protein
MGAQGTIVPRQESFYHGHSKPVNFHEPKESHGQKESLGEKEIQGRAPERHKHEHDYGQI